MLQIHGLIHWQGERIYWRFHDIPLLVSSLAFVVNMFNFLLAPKVQYLISWMLWTIKYYGTACLVSSMTSSFLFWNRPKPAFTKAFLYVSAFWGGQRRIKRNKNNYCPYSLSSFLPAHQACFLPPFPFIMGGWVGVGLGLGLTPSSARGDLGCISTAWKCAMTWEALGNRTQSFSPAVCTEGPAPKSNFICFLSF